MNEMGMSVWQELHDAMDGNLRMSKRRTLLDAYRKELADIVRSFKPLEPEGDDSGAELLVVDALEDAAKAVERGHA